jgi:hypothetical protein
MRNRVEFQRRDAQTFGVDLQAVGGIRSRHAAAHIGVMTDGGGVGDRRTLGEQRFEDEDVRQMHAAIVRIVVDEDVAGMHVRSEMCQHRLQGDRDRAQMAGQ